jgi:putative salt-induced outer membrane protein YdiY
MLVVCSSAMLADQVALKNGDRLTGTIEKSDGKTLLIKTEFAGEVTVQWSAVQAITATEPLHVGLNNGQTVVGAVTTSDGSLAVATTSARTVTAPIGNVLTLRNAAEQAAFDKSQHPGLTEGWKGGANVGFALTGGNSQTKSLALAFTAARTGLHDKFLLYENTVYATNDGPGAVPNVTANTNAGGLRYDHDLTPRLFAFVGADFMNNALQGLNLRSVGSVGLGFHAVKNDRTTLDLLAGGNFTDENYTQTLTNPTPPPPTLTSKLVHNFGALTLGEELTHKHGGTIITQKMYVFPNLTNTGQYRATFDLGTVTKISKWLGWQNAFGDIYVTNPPAGAKQNDVVFTTGLNFSFVH